MQEYPIRVRFLAWTILNQDKIRNYFITYLYLAVYVLCFLVLFGIISFDLMIVVSLVGGFSLILLCYLFIVARKKAILIEPDRNGREILYKAMLMYMSKKGHYQ